MKALRYSRIATRVLMNWVVCFGLCALTSEIFDGTEILFLAMLAPALLAIELAVYFGGSPEHRQQGRASCAPLVAVSMVAILAVALRPDPKFEPSKFARVQLQVLIERHG